MTEIIIKVKILKYINIINASPFLTLGILFSEKNPLGKSSTTMKPIEEAMEDEVFEADSANDFQNSPEEV